MNFEKSIEQLKARTRHVRKLVTQKDWRVEKDRVLKCTDADMVFTALLEGCTPQQVASLLMIRDQKVQSQMNPSCKSFQIITTIQKYPLIHTQVQIGVPLVADRDFLFLSNVVHHRTNKIIICNCSVDASEAQNVITEKTSAVRAQMHHSAWIIQGEGDGGVRVYYACDIDMNGWLPHSLTRNASSAMSAQIQYLSNYVWH